MTQHYIEIHKKIRQNRPPAFADFMDLVYLRMSEADRELLPGETSKYVNSVVAFALRYLSEFGEAIAEMVAGVYAQSPGGERFILDPTRLNEISESILFLDTDGHLVTVRNPELVRERETRDDLGTLVMKRYQSYEVLTGLLSGRRFDSYSRPLPSEPVYQPGVILGATAAALPLTGGVSTPTLPESRSDLRVFLCYASEDRETVRSLYSKLQQSGFHPWLDKEDLLPGQDWDLKITRAVRAAHVVLVCLSQHSEKRGYVQKEIKRALDVADEQPEGSIFLIPVRLVDCHVPERLNQWQWVDIFKEDGYAKLEVALRVAAKGVSI
jgi:hypothetical protein